MRTEPLDKTLEDHDHFMAEFERLKEAIAAAVKNEISASKRAIEQDRRGVEDSADDIKEGTGGSSMRDRSVTARRDHETTSPQPISNSPTPLTERDQATSEPLFSV